MICTNLPRHISFFRNLPEEAWTRTGAASGNPFTVRVCAYIVAGHTAHHAAVLREKQAVAVQTGLGITAEQVPAAVRAKKLAWPAGLSEQVQLVKDSLRSNQMLGVDEVASRFVRARRARVQEILETLAALGQIRRVNDRFVI